MRFRERIAWGLVGTAIILGINRTAAADNCTPATSTTTTETRPALIIEPPHLLPPATLPTRLPETS